MFWRWAGRGRPHLAGHHHLSDAGAQTDKRDRVDGRTQYPVDGEDVGKPWTSRLDFAIT